MKFNCSSRARPLFHLQFKKCPYSFHIEIFCLTTNSYRFIYANLNSVSGNSQSSSKWFIMSGSGVHILHTAVSHRSQLHSLYVSSESVSYSRLKLVHWLICTDFQHHVLDSSAGIRWMSQGWRDLKRNTRRNLRLFIFMCLGRSSKTYESLGTYKIHK